MPLAPDCIASLACMLRRVRARSRRGNLRLRLHSDRCTLLGAGRRGCGLGRRWARSGLVSAGRRGPESEYGMRLLGRVSDVRRDRSLVLCRENVGHRGLGLRLVRRLDLVICDRRDPALRLGLQLDRGIVFRRDRCRRGKALVSGAHMDLEQGSRRLLGRETGVHRDRLVRSLCSRLPCFDLENSPSMRRQGYQSAFGLGGSKPPFRHLRGDSYPQHVCPRHQPK